MTIILQIVVALASAMIVIFFVDCLNRMTKATNHVIRAAYVLIAAGAFCEIVAIFEGHVPVVAETLLITGFGLLCFVDGRSPSRRERTAQ